MSDPTAADAIARAWHPIGCRYRLESFETCRYRSQHEHTGRQAIIELAKAGWTLRHAPAEAETIPMFGETP